MVVIRQYIKSESKIEEENEKMRKSRESDCEWVNDGKEEERSR